MTTPAINTYSTSNRGGSHKRYDVHGNVIQNFPTTPNLASVSFESRPASVTAGLIRNFRLCSNWTHSRRRWVNPDYVATWNSGTDRFVDEGCIWSMASNAGVPPGVSVNQRNECLTKALLKLKAQDIHVGEFVAEGREAIHMVSSHVREIARSVLRFRRNPTQWMKVISTETGNLPRFRWCEIPSAWLELQYGWKPLLADIMGAANHMSHRWRFNVPYVSVDAYVKQEDEIHSSCSLAGGADGRYRFKLTSKVWTNLVFGLKNPTVAEISALGLINPAEIVWEVLPYSFVVDWLFPIGDWISTWTAAAGYQFITGGQSMKQEVRPLSGSITSNPQSIRVSPPQLRGLADYFSRVCFSSTPVPGVYVKDPFTVSHVANAMSLLAQAFR